MGRYGLDWDKGLKNFTDEDWNTVLTETTKIIDEDGGTLEVAFSLNDRGIYYDNKGEYDKAITDYTFAIEKRTDFAHAYRNRGLTYWTMKQFENALDDFNEALRLFPEVDPSAKEIQWTKECIKKVLEEKRRING